MVSKSVIIVAGGSGTRMKQYLPKQFLMMKGKPIVVHTIEAFYRYDPTISVVLVLPTSHLETWKDIHIEYLEGRKITLAIGGATRFQSVKSGLEQVETGLVAIHDAVRPLVSEEIISASFDAAEKTGSGVVMVPAKDSIREKKGEHTTARDRSDILMVQTPQTFQVDLIKKAFQVEESPSFTDDASVYEANNHTVTPVSGDYRNIKITTPVDLQIAETLLK
jgi:2-C-methyl-D-erythritol 4-phosphate cytidylyltransferase